MITKASDGARRTSGQPVKGVLTFRPPTVLLLSFAYLGLLGLVSVFLGYPRWATNDDLGMSWIASGIYTGEPSGELVFVHRALGALLALGYQAAPLVPWYALALAFSSLIGLLCLLIVWLPVRKMVRVWVALATPSFLWLTQFPNFTATAILLVGTGLIMMFEPVSGRKSAVALLVGGVGLVTLGMLWRLDAVFVAGIVLSPIVVYRFLRPETRPSGLVPAGIGLLSIPAVYALLKEVNASCFLRSTSACRSWEIYDHYNKIRGSFHGAPRGELLALVYDKIPWTNESFWLFSNFAYADAPVFDLQSLQTADALTPNFVKVGDGGLVAHFAHVFLGSTGVWVPFIGFLLVLTSIVPRAILSRSYFGILSAVFIAWVIGVGFISLIRLPTPVLVSSVICLGMGIGATTCFELSGRLERGKSLTLKFRAFRDGVAALGFSLLVVHAVFLPSGWVAARDTGAEVRATLSAFQETYASVAGNARVLAPGAAGSLFDTNPYELTNRTYPYPLITGWSVFSPLWAERKRHLGFSDDVYSDLAASRTIDYTRSQVEEPTLLLSNKETAWVTSRFLWTELGYPSSIIALSEAKLLPQVSLWSMRQLN